MKLLQTASLALMLILASAVASPAKADLWGGSGTGGTLSWLDELLDTIQQIDWRLENIDREIQGSDFGCWVNWGKGILNQERTPVCLEKAQKRLRACIGSSVSGEQYKCLLCGPLAALVEPAMIFSKTIMLAFARISQSFANAVAMLALVVIALRGTVTPNAGAQFWMDSLKHLGIIALVTLLLTQFGMNWVGRASLVPLEAATAIGQFFIGMMRSPQNLLQVIYSFSPTPMATQYGVGSIVENYVSLWSQVEVATFPVVCLGFEKMTGNASAIFGGEIFAGLFLIMPYLFVMGVFCAFLVQTMFYYVGVESLMPLIVIGLIFGTTRGILGSAVKILITGALTVVLASIAMGLTSHIVQIYTPGMVQKLIQSASLSLVWDLYEYWSLVFIGFMAVILHLLAPRIGANLGGAVDSAASAAAVVAAGQMLGTRALLATKGGLLGSGGRFGGLVGTPAAWAAGKGAGVLGQVPSMAGNLIKSLAKARGQ